MQNLLFYSKKSLVDGVEYRRQVKEKVILLYDIKIRKVLYVRDSYLDGVFCQYSQI